MWRLQMEEMYVQDLSNATEIVLDLKRKVRAPGEPRHPAPVATSGGGSIGRVAAGALRIGNAVGAAFTNRRVLEPVEARILLTSGALLAGLSVISALFPVCLRTLWSPYSPGSLWHYSIEATSSTERAKAQGLRLRRRRHRPPRQAWNSGCKPAL
jgi:hypothetical protein